MSAPSRAKAPGLPANPNADLKEQYELHADAGQPAAVGPVEAAVAEEGPQEGLVGHQPLFAPRRPVQPRLKVHPLRLDDLVEHRPLLVLASVRLCCRGPVGRGKGNVNLLFHPDCKQFFPGFLKLYSLFLNVKT